jgi:hypothetical protein
MKIFYDSTDNNQVQAIYTTDTNSIAWNTFDNIETTDPTIQSQILQYGRDCRLTIVDSVLTAVTQYDHPTDHSLDICKATRRNAVDLQSGVLIGGGLTYDGKLFSLSANAQMNWTNVYQNRANWTYPLKVSIYATSGEYSLADQTAVENFYSAGISRIKTILDGGRQLKIDIDAAVDQTALDAVVDNRT